MLLTRHTETKKEEGIVLGFPFSLVVVDRLASSLICMFLVFVSLRSGLIVASLRHNSLKEVVLLFILNIIVQAKKISSSSLDRDWFIIFWAKVATKWLAGEMRCANCIHSKTSRS